MNFNFWSIYKGFLFKRSGKGAALEAPEAGAAEPLHLEIWNGRGSAAPILCLGRERECRSSWKERCPPLIIFIYLSYWVVLIFDGYKAYKHIKYKTNDRLQTNVKLEALSLSSNDKLSMLKSLGIIFHLIGLIVV